MLQTHRLTLPLSEETVQAFKIGDLVYLSGEIMFSAGLPTYQRLAQCVAEGEALPVDLTHGTLFHLGSFTRETGHGYEMLYINPTTSTRFNPYMPGLIRGLGLRATGGKGGLDEHSARAMRDTGCVYLSFLGGGCALLSQAIREVTGVYWEEMISHYRLVRLRVEGLGPLTVGIDAHGNSLYDKIMSASALRRPDIQAMLEEERNASASGRGLDCRKAALDEQ